MDRKSVLEVGKVLYHSGLPFRVRLFNILASLGFIISLCNGVLSYWNNGDRKLLLINTGIALLSLSLLFYAYHSKKYQRCYFITIVVIFMFLFPIMFFKSGGYKGGMPSFYIFGILFTIFMLEGWLMFFYIFENVDTSQRQEKHSIQQLPSAHPQQSLFPIETRLPYLDNNRQSQS